MDQSEQLVEQWLRSIGYEDIVYEPDGNMPPDLLVDGTIAIEVRRLNQNVVSPSGEAEGLEEVFIPTLQRIANYLSTLGSSGDGESWYVCIDISRPPDTWKELKPKLDEALISFMNFCDRAETSLRITKHLTVDLLRAGRPYPSFFLMGAASDGDSGGFVLHEVYKNLNRCIQEKGDKIAKFRSKYPVWWLALPDHIGYGLDAQDRRQFADLPAITHGWEKIVLINPLNPKHAFEI